MKAKQLAVFLLAGTLLFGNTISAFAEETNNPEIVVDEDEDTDAEVDTETEEVSDIEDNGSGGSDLGGSEGSGSGGSGTGVSNDEESDTGNSGISLTAEGDDADGEDEGVGEPATGGEGYTDIPIEGIEADGETITKFEVDNSILGGDLIVSIPAEMTLEYDAANEVLTKLDYVSASGRCAANQKLEIRTATSITYADDSNASITVPGTVAFGVTEDDKQLENWTAAELLVGVKTPDDIVKRDIAATVQKSDIDYIGSYSSLILYNINVVSTDDTVDEPEEGETT